MQRPCRETGCLCLTVLRKRGFKWLKLGTCGVQKEDEKIVEPNHVESVMLDLWTLRKNEFMDF